MTPQVSAQVTAALQGPVAQGTQSVAALAQQTSTRFLVFCPKIPAAYNSCFLNSVFVIMLEFSRRSIMAVQLSVAGTLSLAAVDRASLSSRVVVQASATLAASLQATNQINSDLNLAIAILSNRSCYTTARLARCRSQSIAVADLCSTTGQLSNHNNTVATILLSLSNLQNSKANITTLTTTNTQTLSNAVAVSAVFGFLLLLILSSLSACSSNVQATNAQAAVTLSNAIAVGSLSELLNGLRIW